MAGYSENREDHLELKYLRKVLSDVDEGIPIPDSIRGENLLHRLEGVSPATYRPESAKSPFRLSPRMFTLQSGLSYAAAFVLILALSYGLRMTDHQVEREMDLTAGQQDAGEYLEQVIPPDPEDAAGAAEPDEIAAGGQEEPSAAAQPQTEAGEPDPAQGHEDEVLGVGGGGRTIQLAEDDRYSYHCRRNDENDPEKTTALTLEIVDRDSGEMMASVDLPEMQQVVQCFTVPELLMLVGETEEGAMVLSYRLEDVAQPREALSLYQPGEYVDSRQYKGYIHLVTRYEGGTLELEEEILPGSVSEERCIIAVADPVDGSVVQKAFVGADGEIKLYNINAYISYSGEDYEDPEDYHFAQVALDEMDIQLGSVSD